MRCTPWTLQASKPMGSSLQGSAEIPQLRFNLAGCRAGAAVWCQVMMGCPHVTKCGSAQETTRRLQQAHKSKTRCLSKLDCTLRVCCH